MGTTGYAEEFEPKVLESGDDARVDNYQPSSLSKKLVLKQDLRIVPLCAGIYLLCFLDRSNIGNAKVLNEDTGDDLLDETHMSDTQYVIALMLYVQVVLQSSMKHHAAL